MFRIIYTDIEMQVHRQIHWKGKEKGQKVTKVTQKGQKTPAFQGASHYRAQRCVLLRSIEETRSSAYE